MMPGGFAGVVMKLILILLVIVAFAGTANAQQQPQERPDLGEQTVVNEDGGQTFIIKLAASKPGGLIENRNGTNIPEIEQHSIFLGNRWAAPTLRGRESGLSNLLASVHENAQVAELSQSGIKNLFGPVSSQEKLDIKSDRRISDLEIQRVLGAMLNEGSVPSPSAGAIYVVFLDPGLQSTLGSLIAGKHYLAYHGFVNISAMKVHYVVIPFEANSPLAYQIALRALVVAALHSL